MSDMYGPVLGTVSDNQDPDNMGRVKVSVKKMGKTVVTDWIPVLTLYGGTGAGSFFLPDKDDTVAVAFFGDSPKSGVILGSVWTGDQEPPETGENTASDLNKDGENNLRFIRSKSGQQIIFDDKSGDEKLQILSSDSKTRYEFLAKDKMMKLETDGDFVLKAKTKFAIEAKQGTLKFAKGLKIKAEAVSIESKKPLKIKATKDVEVKGKSIKLN